jgi:hypothetical protein
MGATYRHNKQLIGHKFCIPLCVEHDDVVGFNRRKFKDEHGLQSSYWARELLDYAVETNNNEILTSWTPEILAIEGCNE